MNTRGYISLLAVLSASAGYAFDFVNQQPVPQGEGGPFSDPLNYQLVADDFTSAGTGVATQLTFWGSYSSHGTPYGNGVTQSFDVYLYADNAGQVGSQLQYEGVGATLTNSGDFVQGGTDAIYRYDATLSGLNLTGGAGYWLSVQCTQVPDWRWHNGIGPNDYAALDHGSGWWVFSEDNRRDNAFVLSSVPEPATMLALGLGLVGLAARRRRK